jgi:hypothetical protein
MQDAANQYPNNKRKEKLKWVFLATFLGKQLLGQVLSNQLKMACQKIPVPGAEREVTP